MELRLTGNVIAQNVQMGETNTMTVTYGQTGDILKEKDWDELKKFLAMRLDELPENENTYVVAKKALEYVENRDEQGFKGFLVRNKENFFSNVLSNVVSSGLVLLLSRFIL